jgi:uncharacterized protein YktA (UPF0223 family)
MKFIQTLYSSADSEFKHNSFGWAKPCYHWISWVLSSLSLQELHPDQTILYCNQTTNNFLPRLELPYRRFDVSLTNFKLANQNLWALPKLFTYAQQTEPFLHIDGDVFLFSRFDEKLLSSGLIAQNEEIATEYYTSTQEQLIQHFTWFPDCVAEDFNKPEPIHAVNAGIIGGHDIDFFQEYTREAFKYVEQNLNHLSKINADRFNVFFEQHLFFSLAKKKGKDIGYLFPDIVNDNQYQHLGEFHEVPCSKSYLHLLGHYKKDEATCLQMAAKLRELYPDYYERVIRFCHDNGMYYPYQKLYMHYLYSSVGVMGLYESSKAAYKAKESVSSKTESINLGYISCFKLLENCLNETDNENNPLQQLDDILDDYHSFKQGVIEKIESKKFHKEFLYGRDLESQQWYCNLFGCDDEAETKTIVRCASNFIVQSNYDWAAIYNSRYRVGVGYYEQLVIEKGNYNSLIVQEATDYEISLYDIDEMEALILEYISKPKTIVSVLKEMEQHMEENVLLEHYAAFKELVVSFLKQLVVKKAIAPFP